MPDVKLVRTNLCEPDAALNVAPVFCNPEPSPKNDVAVTELIPEIFVELSPTISPFALIFPPKVDKPDTFIF